MLQRERAREEKQGISMDPLDADSSDVFCGEARVTFNGRGDDVTGP